MATLELVYITLTKCALSEAQNMNMGLFFP